MNHVLRHLFLFSLIALGIKAQAQQVVRNLKITVLSTMLAQAGKGEWGFAALVEADSAKFLFDTGAYPRTVLENSEEINSDLRQVPTLILSHNHDDHTGGWMTLYDAYGKNKKALSVTHGAPGLFDVRVDRAGKEFSLRMDSSNYIRGGGKIILHHTFEEISPGIYLTGNVPRKYPEKNYSTGLRMKDKHGLVIDDNVPEDMSMVIRTKQGLILLSGCGHAGIINTIEHIKNNLNEPVYAAIGGFHLFQNNEEQIKWTSDNLKANGIKYFMGAHCTGIDAVYQIRKWTNLGKAECVIGSVGDTFDNTKGFTIGPLAK